MPKSFELWDGLIVELLKHLESRYGMEELEKWFFEVWNEPDLDFFFAGDQEDYFLLYEHTARAVKSVGANLRTGGPATANNKWIPDFVNYITIHQMIPTGMQICIWIISSEKKST